MLRHWLASLACSLVCTGAIGCAGPRRDRALDVDPLIVDAKPKPVLIHTEQVSTSNALPEDAPHCHPTAAAASGVRVAAHYQGEQIPTPPVEVMPPVREMDLTTALAIADAQGTRIGLAAARYREAYARLTAARVLWLPSLRAGASYNHHDGRLQNIEGDVFEVSRSALNGGLGANAVAAGSPAIPGLAANFHTADALFQPRIAEYAASARYAATRSETNDALLDVAVAYLNLLRAVQQLRIAEETLGRTQQLVNLTSTFAESGAGTQADADRARTELMLRWNEVARAEEASIVASARLAELLHLDPSQPIVPLEPIIVPIDLVCFEAPLQEFLATGLSNRPELAEARYLVAEAVQRYRREKYAPFIPSVLLGVSQTGFGGGTGSELNDFEDRFDLDAAAWWEIRNLGLGERSQRSIAATRQQQASWQHMQTMDRVAREVMESHAQVASRRRQIAVAESGIVSARDSYRRNLDRIREGQGLPLEVLQSLQALDAANREYLRTVMDYNEAQFRFQRALGWPIH